MELRNKAYIKNVYNSAAGVHIDVEWLDKRPYELDDGTKEVLKRGLQWRDHGKAQKPEAVDNTPLGQMCRGNRIPCAQVFVKKSWLTHFKTLIKAHTAAVKKYKAAKHGSQ